MHGFTQYHSQCGSGKVDVNDVVSYAGRLSIFTAAPPNYDPDQPSVMRAEPPYPDEATMRAGLLYKMQHNIPPTATQDVAQSNVLIFGGVRVPMPVEISFCWMIIV